MHSNTTVFEFDTPARLGREYIPFIEIPIWSQKQHQDVPSGDAQERGCQQLPPKLSARIKSFFMFKNPKTAFKFSKNFGIIFHYTIIAISEYLIEETGLPESASPELIVSENPLLRQLVRPTATLSTFRYNGTRRNVSAFRSPLDPNKARFTKQQLRLNTANIRSKLDVAISPATSKFISGRLGRELYNLLIQNTTGVEYVGPKTSQNIAYISTDEFVQIILSSAIPQLPTQLLNFLFMVVNIIANLLTVKVIDLITASKRLTVNEEHIFEAIEYVIQDAGVKTRIFELIREQLDQ